MAKGYGQGNSPRFKSGLKGSPTQTGKFAVKVVPAVGPGGRTSTLKGQTRVTGAGKRVSGGFGKKGFNRADTPGTIS